MKKVFALLLALALVFSLAACGGEKNPKETTGAPAPGNDPGVTETTEPAVELPSYTFTQYGNAKLTILGAEFAKDDEGEDFLRIYYDYTNTSDTAVSAYPGTALHYMSVTQDGKECQVISFDKYDECAIPEDLGYNNGVLPGLTNRHTMLIRCDPAGGPVEVSCYIMIGSWMYEPDQVKCFVFQMDPKDLPSVPEPLKVAPITNPTYAVGLPTTGTSEKYSLSIDAWTLAQGNDGEKVLRVMLTMTSHEQTDAWPPSMIATVEAYQDGIALPWFSNWDLEATPEDEAFDEDLYPGETVHYNALFLLRNDSPVEVVAEQQYDDLRLGTVCDVAAMIKAIEDAEKAAQDAINAANAAAIKALAGTWDSTDGWDDHYTFQTDGTGVLEMTGDKYPFKYTLNDGLLSLYYDDGDYAEYYLKVSGDELTLSDDYDNADVFVRASAGGDAPTEQPTEPPVETTAPALTLAQELIGTWVDAYETETYSFNADGTGYQIYEGVTYTFTYKLTDDYMEITYSDGSSDAFNVEIYDGTFIIAGYWTYNRK